MFNTIIIQKINKASTYTIVLCVSQYYRIKISFKNIEVDNLRLIVTEEGKEIKTITLISAN